MMSEQQKDEEIRPPRRGEPIFMLPVVVTVLGGSMLIIQALSSFVLNAAGRVSLLVWLGFIPARLIAPDQFPGGLWPLAWTAATYGLLHAGWEHVIGNVVWLVIFGTPVARRYGTGPTLIIFFVSSIVGAIAFAISEFHTIAYLVGASGGIAGLTGAATRFIFQPVVVGRDPETGEPILLGRRMATIPELLRSPAARAFSIIWVVLNCLVPLVPLVIGQDVAIAWQAHLGGFFTGLLLVPFFEHGGAGKVQHPNAATDA